MEAQPPLMVVEADVGAVVGVMDLLVVVTTGERHAAVYAVKTEAEASARGQNADAQLTIVNGVQFMNGKLLTRLYRQQSCIRS